MKPPMGRARSATSRTRSSHDAPNDCTMTPTPKQPSLQTVKADVKQRLMDHTPALLKDVVVSVAGGALFRRRRGRTFRESLSLWYSMRDLPRADLVRIQAERTDQIISHASTLSGYYRAKYAGIRSTDLTDFPILEKEELRAHIADIVIPGNDKLRKCYTGGTTGKSLVVYSSSDSDGERFARQEAMWAMHGYKLGRDRIAWFSGRHLIGTNDVSANRFWRNNLLERIRYYSTFHMAPRNLHYYVEDLARFKPKFMNGFPSAIAELASFIDMNGMEGSLNIQAIFT